MGGGGRRRSWEGARQTQKRCAPLCTSFVERNQTDGLNLRTAEDWGRGKREEQDYDVFGGEWRDIL